jgi:glycosyltransferase involved in cell wall biosynthesis
MRSLRILFASYPTVSFLGEAGGLRKHIVMTAQALDNRGHNVTLFNPWDPNSMDVVDVANLFAAQPSVFEIALKLKAKNIPITFMPMADYKFSWLFLRFLAFSSRLIPYFISPWGVAKKLCGLADFITARSDWEANLIAKAFDCSMSKIRVVPIGVEDKFASASPELFFGQYEFSDFVLAVGNVADKRKNFLRLIESVGPMNIPLVIIGKLDGSSDYVSRCRAAVDKFSNVHLLGFVESDVLISAYAASAAFILPSIVEGVGIAALEAALAGTRVIVTEVGGPPYYFGPLADYVNPKSKKSIQSGIRRALERPKSLALREHIVENFLWDRVVSDLESVYAEVLEEKRGKG